MFLHILKKIILFRANIKRFFNVTETQLTLIMALDFCRFQKNCNCLLLRPTRPSSHAGLHWYCVMKNDNCLEIFDALGTSMLAVKERLSSYEQDIDILVNQTPVQPSDSSLCGEFVIYFIVNRLCNIDLDFEDVLNDLFSENQESNVARVRDFLSLLQNGKNSRKYPN